MVEPRKLGDFVADAATLSEEAFRKKHGEMFVVLTGTTRRHAGMLMTMGGRDTNEAQTDVTLFEVWGLRGDAPEVTLGRARNNAIVVADASVSSFHAALVRGAHGWAVFDAESRNGTKVDGASAPTRAEGDALALRSGCSLRVGSVDLLVADASVLIALARKLKKASAT